MLWWRRLRNLDRIEVLNAELASRAHDLTVFKQNYARVSKDLEREKERRITIEAVAVERTHHIDSLNDEIRHLRTQNDQISAERLKSLDLLNQRLVESRVEPPTPDLEKFKATQEQLASMRAGVQAISRVRQIHHQMDLAILGKMHPQFAKKEPALPMNEPVTPSGNGDAA